MTLWFRFASFFRCSPSTFWTECIHIVSKCLRRQCVQQQLCYSGYLKYFARVLLKKNNSSSPSFIWLSWSSLRMLFRGFSIVFVFSVVAVAFSFFLGGKWRLFVDLGIFYYSRKKRVRAVDVGFVVGVAAFGAWSSGFWRNCVVPRWWWRCWERATWLFLPLQARNTSSSMDYSITAYRLYWPHFFLWLWTGSNYSSTESLHFFLCCIDSSFIFFPLLLCYILALFLGTFNKICATFFFAVSISYLRLIKFVSNAFEWLCSRYMSYICVYVCGWICTSICT